MSGKTDRLKGRVKKVVGDLAGNGDLVSEGETDRLAGDVKETVGRASAKVGQYGKKARKTGKESIEKVEDVLR